MAVRIRKTLKQYKLLQADLGSRLDELQLKREALHSTLPFSLTETIIEEFGLDEEGSDRQRLVEMKREKLKATEVLLHILQIKMDFITEMVLKLESFAQSNHHQATPYDLQLGRFYDWVETNQQIYELNTQLYEIEKSKWKIEKPHRQLIIPADHQGIIATESISKAGLNEPFNNLDSSILAVSLYVTERLQPRDHRMTFEATKIEEFITECSAQHHSRHIDLGAIKGAHPQSYHGFVEVLCNYIVERHRSSQGEELPYATIYTAIEHNVMPRIKQYVLKYIKQVEDDQMLQIQCKKFSNITLSQLRIPLKLRSNELVPFADAIAHMRATYFSQSPTDKMFSVVAAAKALHEQLNAMEEGSIDGDTFLDFWVYVTIKANVKDMATNVMFMSEYGNPQLSIAEAGYYLTTLYAAISYIKTLTPQQLKQQEENNSKFLICELEEARQLASQEGTCMELIGQTVLVGFKAGAIKKWLMDTRRLYSTVLIETGKTSDKVHVSIVKLSSDKSSSHHVEYFYEAFTSRDDMTGLSCRSTQEGFIMIADPQQCGDELVMLNPDNVSEQLITLRYAIQLIRLGSQDIEENDDQLLAHASLPRQEQQSPFSFISSSHNSNQISSIIETQLDMQDDMLTPITTANGTTGLGGLRTRFSLPTRNQLKLLVKGKRAASSRPIESIQQEGLGEEVDRRITIMAEVYEDQPINTNTNTNTTANTSSALPDHCGGTVLYDDGSVQKDGGKREKESVVSLQESKEESMVMSGSSFVSEGLVSSTNSNSVVPPTDLLSVEYITYLEDNFIENHLYSHRNGSVKDSVFDVTKQCQMMLQRLNFLSSIHILNGIYDNATMNAVQSFQVLHNQQDTFSSVRLPEEGILSVATLQYLRQELLTIFANLMRLRKDVGLDHLLSNFDPLSTDPNDMRQFHELISNFQERVHVHTRTPGVLCSKTVANIKSLIQKQRTFSSRSERGNTL